MGGNEANGAEEGQSTQRCKSGEQGESGGEHDAIGGYGYLLESEYRSDSRSIKGNHKVS